MDVLIYLVPLALMLGLLGLVCFLWSLQSGQYDDLEGAAWRAIMDDDTPLILALPSNRELPPDGQGLPMHTSEERPRHARAEGIGP